MQFAGRKPATAPAVGATYAKQVCMSAALTTPATKTGFANVFVASPPKKGGEFLHYLLVSCVFPSIREVATPRGLRTGLGSGFAMTLIYISYIEIT